MNDTLLRVVASKNDAQLLMIRLGIDGFFCGKRKIFLKYYHIDFLSKFYEEQYKRIVTVQVDIGDIPLLISNPHL